MRFLLINTNPAVSKLVNASLNRIGHEAREIGNYDDLPLDSFIAVIVDSDSYSASHIDDLLAVSIAPSLIYLKQQNAAVPKGFQYSLAKPFLPTDFITFIVSILKKNSELKRFITSEAEEFVSMLPEEGRVEAKEEKKIETPALTPEEQEMENNFINFNFYDDLQKKEAIFSVEEQGEVVPTEPIDMAFKAPRIEPDTPDESAFFTLSDDIGKLYSEEGAQENSSSSEEITQNSKPQEPFSFSDDDLSSFDGGESAKKQPQTPPFIDDKPNSGFAINKEPQTPTPFADNSAKANIQNEQEGKSFNSSLAEQDNGFVLSGEESAQEEFGPSFSSEEIIQSAQAPLSFDDDNDSFAIPSSSFNNEESAKKQPQTTPQDDKADSGFAINKEPQAPLSFDDDSDSFAAASDSSFGSKEAVEEPQLPPPPTENGMVDFDFNIIDEMTLPEPPKEEENAKEEILTSSHEEVLPLEKETKKEESFLKEPTEEKKQFSGFKDLAKEFDDLIKPSKKESAKEEIKLPSYASEHKSDQFEGLNEKEMRKALQEGGLLPQSAEEMVRHEIQSVVQESVQGLLQGNILRDVLKGLKMNITITFEDKE